MREDVVQGMGDAVLEQPTAFRVVVRWQEWSRVSLHRVVAGFRVETCCCRRNNRVKSFVSPRSECYVTG